LKTILSSRVQRIKPSPTLAVTARAAALKAQGKDIIGLGAGEPDFDTPEFIKEAAIKAIQNGFTKYTAVDGTPSLKAAIIAKFKRENDLTYTPKQIIVSSGCKHSIYNLFQAMLNEGDEVLIPAPYWVSYPDMTLLADATPVILKTRIENSFKITPEQLEEAITPKTKILVLNSPSNPTGFAYTRAELVALGAVLEKHEHVFIASDDIYEHNLWTKDPFVNIVMACPKLYDRTFVLNGVSKAYAMTGWRIGYCAGPLAIIQAMSNIQSQSTSNPTSIAQVAAQAALEGDQGCIAPMIKAFKERHDYVVTSLNKMPGVRCLAGDGTFYAFPDVSEAIKARGLKDDLALSEALLLEAGVAVVPGSAFGAPDCIRLSFASSMATMENAMERLKAYFGA
jgi:aspartate aminotransferase